MSKLGFLPAIRLLPPALLDALVEAVRPQLPEAAALQRMRERVLAATSQSPDAVRAADGEWKEFLRGVKLKVLHRDADAGVQTALWKLQPGARVPGHAHRIDEECLVLEGHIEMGDVVYGPGDFVFFRRDTRHTGVHTRDGALLLIRGELAPEFNPLTKFVLSLLAR